MGLFEQTIEKRQELTHPIGRYIRQTPQECLQDRSSHYTAGQIKIVQMDVKEKQVLVESNSVIQQADRLLLQRIQAEDAEALQIFYDNHAQKTYNLIMRIVRDTAVAEEILQETFWQVWKKAEAYRGSGSVAAWLYRIARNKSLDSLRRHKARPQIASEQDPQDIKTDYIRTAHTAVEAHVSHQIDKQHLHRALNTIPSEQRHCLELAFFGNMSQRQIAAHTNTSLGTVKTRIRLGLEKLERFMRASGYKEEDVR